MTQRLHHHTFDNGLVLLAEPMDWLESAAFTLIVPSGCVWDPGDRLGLTNLTCEIMQRGCGSRDSRQFMEDLDRLGAERSASVSCSHTSFGAACISENIHDVIGIFADMIQRPHLPEDQLDEGRHVCLHELRAIKDDLAQRVIQEIRKAHYPDPWGRSASGVAADLEEMSIGDVRELYGQHYTPRNAILSVAGKLDWSALRDHAESMFGDWSSEPNRTLNVSSTTQRWVHIDHDSSQTHIAVAYPSVTYGHPDYYQARGAVGILSDGMSSRLFTEVRENRGLCYAVYASCHSLLDRGCVIAYAGTSTERAQETLDVLIAELRKLADGVSREELGRLKARIKSGLIMQQESSSARSSAMAGDWYYLGRMQTLDELGSIVDGLTCDSINNYLNDNPPSDFTIVTLGAKRMEAPIGIS